MIENIRWLVVTPTLGKSPYLAETIASVRHLPGKVEHIVVCPSSALSEIVITAPYSRIVTEPIDGAVGMYGAINIGLRAARHEYDLFCYLNDDDFFLPDISRITSSVIAGEQVIYYGKAKVVDENKKFLYQFPYSTFSKMAPTFLRHGIMPFMQPSMIVPRSVMNKVGLFDSSYRYCGDLDFIIRASSVGISFCRLNYFIAAFRLRKGQLSGSRSNMVEESAKAFKKAGFGVPSKLQKAIVKMIFSLINLRTYVDRIRNLGVFTSNEAFYGSKDR